MEKSSRDAIQDRIRDKNDGRPETADLSQDTNEALSHYHATDHSKLSKLAQLRVIYRLADKVSEADEAISVCRKGCAWCCRIAIEITPLEADYIAANTDNKIITRLLKKPDPIGYCPLLNKQTGECTVYEYRPFNCRTFRTYDSPEYCKNGESHWVSGGPHNNYGSNALYSLAVALLEIEIGRKLDPTINLVVESRIKDIRKFFK